MKRLIAFVLVFVLCLSLCSCGAKSTDAKATIVTNDGKTVELTAQELFDEFDANEARFEKIYGGADIEFVGTVKTIKTDTGVYSGDNKVTSQQNKIVFEEGWCLIIGAQNTKYDLADYYPGQELKVSTGIVSAAFDTEFLQSVADNSRVVWLAGNDQLHYEGDNINSQITEIVEL